MRATGLLLGLTVLTFTTSFFPGDELSRNDRRVLRLVALFGALGVLLWLVNE